MLPMRMPVRFEAETPKRSPPFSHLSGEAPDCPDCEARSRSRSPSSSGRPTSRGPRACKCGPPWRTARHAAPRCRRRCSGCHWVRPRPRAQRRLRLAQQNDPVLVFLYESVRVAEANGGLVGHGISSILRSVIDVMVDFHRQSQPQGFKQLFQAFELRISALG